MNQADDSSAAPRGGHAAPPRMLNITQAARLLGVSVRTFHELRRRSIVPEPYRLGARGARWDRVELIESIRTRAPRGTAPEPAQLVAARRARAKA